MSPGFVVLSARLSTADALAVATAAEDATLALR